ncbi:ABC transporter permease [Tropicimonas sp. IMCC6043]|uniref:ABC transporter permease n=1 Tax=Tropicimonas sp. IMCC6043 TaxID=2510645 RepID=UPI00101D8ADF|nr:ABC transporter permease [Tropicimonas sp. IMCC6043]RYH06465.1 ABC transporter permease [Tropicimonas sp. IMCC6043]
MSPLDKKLLRDVRRLWAQALAISLVMAAGVATVLLAMGSYRSLEETRIAYYERQRFANVFATAERAPQNVADQIARIPGVATVETRIVTSALLDIDGTREPATGHFVTVPDGTMPALNRPYLNLGRMPAASAAMEVVVNQAFADAHDFRPGDTIAATLNGKKYRLRIVGSAYSPEFVYVSGPGDIMPDDRRFGVLWINESTLAAIYDLEGAFNSVLLATMRDASQDMILQRVDSLLARYGGQAAHGRSDQFSHGFLNHGLDMLRSMSLTLPPVFFAISFFLIYLTLGRIILLERGQIGLLKAFGYGNQAVVGHYLKFVAILCLAGILAGSAVGVLLGRYVTLLYSDYFRFPLLLFAPATDIYLAAALLPTLAGMTGAVQAALRVAALSPAVAMRPQLPPRYRDDGSAFASLVSAIPPLTKMAFRGAIQNRLRSALTMIGLAMSSAILIASLYLADSMGHLAEVKYMLSERQDATIDFVMPRSPDALRSVQRLPGVLAAEPVRVVPARIRNGTAERRITLYGRSADARLNRIVDRNRHPITPSESGIAINSWLADALAVGLGDRVEIELLGRTRRSASLPVAALSEEYLGLQATMEISALSHLLREGPQIDRADLRIDPAKLDQLYEQIKATPVLSGIALQIVSLANFEAALAVIVTAMAAIYSGLAGTIAFGMVYNAVRISLSERAGELATLRVLGFGEDEVFWVLAGELAILLVLSLPLGWVAGYIIAWVMSDAMAADLMRMPLTLDRGTYALASGAVMTAATFSALFAKRHIRRFDLVAEIKKKE